LEGGYARTARATADVDYDLVYERSHETASSLLGYDDAHLAATPTGPVLDDTIEFGEQSVVAATANVEPRMNPGATLPNQD
jgi:hypothetical protein